MYASVSESMTSVTMATKTTYTVVAAKVLHMSTAHVRSNRRTIVYILKRGSEPKCSAVRCGAVRCGELVGWKSRHTMAS